MNHRGHTEDDQTSLACCRQVATELRCRGSWAVALVLTTAPRQHGQTAASRGRWPSSGSAKQPGRREPARSEGVCWTRECCCFRCHEIVCVYHTFIPYELYDRNPKSCSVYVNTCGPSQLTLWPWSVGNPLRGVWTMRSA